MSIADDIAKIMLGVVKHDLMRLDKPEHYSNFRINESQINTTGSQRWTYSGDWYRHLNPQPPHEIHGVVHRVNSDHYNGAEFHYSPDVVVLGCSMSVGYAITDNYAWPSIISHITSKNVNNIAQPGTNASQQFAALLHHIKKFGNPKEIYLHTPPLDRLEGPYDGEPHKRETSIRQFDWAQETFLEPHHPKHKPYTHVPVIGKKTGINIDQAIWQNLKAIELLTLFTQINDIELSISTWNSNTHGVLSQLDHPNYVGVPDFHQEFLVNAHPVYHFSYPVNGVGQPFCGCELEPQTEQQLAEWDKAFDGEHHPHPGLHMQLHYAEQYLGRKIVNEDLVSLPVWWHGTEISPPLYL
jgi:hypothetical protein